MWQMMNEYVNYHMIAFEAFTPVRFAMQRLNHVPEISDLMYFYKTLRGRTIHACLLEK